MSDDTKTVKVYISYSDGEYYASLVTAPGDLDPGEAKIPEEKWEEYKKFCDEHRKWHSFWKDLDNASFNREQE